MFPRSALLGALLSSLVATPVAAATPSWAISETTAGVTVDHAGRKLAASRGQTLVAGDVVETGQNARATLVRQQDYAIVSPNSRLQVRAPERANDVMRFFEQLGTVVFSINKQSAPHFGVQTKYLAAVVKGTTFSVTVTDRDARVDVMEGLVNVVATDGGMSRLLHSRDAGRVGVADLTRVVFQGGQAEAPPGSEGDEAFGFSFDESGSPFQRGWRRPIFRDAPVSWRDLTLVSAALAAGALCLHILSLLRHGWTLRRTRRGSSRRTR